eukprot:gene6041-7356_t
MFKQKIPTFKQFMLRQDSLRLYKDIFRTIRRVDDAYYRDYLADWARREFKMYKKETDDREIRLLIAQGRKRLGEFQTSMCNSGYTRLNAK